MKRTKKLALSAMLTAFSAVILLIGKFASVLDLTTAVIASFAAVFAHMEMRAPWSFYIWGATSLLSLLLFPSNAAVYYAVFCGIYAILKAYFERLLPAPQWILKLLSFNLLFTGAFGVMYLLGTFPPEFVGIGWLWAAVYALGNVAFLCYDLVISRCILLYSYKLRKRIAKFLK